jgi:outer membrane murein-binding lipoprotein Lpp
VDGEPGAEGASNITDLLSGRLLVRALDDMHEVAQAAKELPAMVEQLSQAVDATREVVGLANAAIDRANASAELLGQMTEPLQVAAGQLARLLERLPLGRPPSN